MTLLTLEPDSTLYFNKTSSTALLSRVLKLTNSSNGFVAFKVKTTAPKSYLVRPANGTLKPKESQEIQIFQQTAAQANDSTHATPDRFLVQAAAVRSGEPAKKEDWNQFTKEQLQEAKLNVVVEEREEEKESKAGKAGARFGDAGRRPGPAGEGATLQVKYDELVNYTLTLEKEKKRADADLAALAPKATAGAKGFSLMALLMAVTIAFLIPHAAKYAGAPIF